MAIYIQIVKVLENKDCVEYEFSTVDEKKGRFQITKKEGIITLVTPLPGDENKSMFARASHKIKKSWKLGEFPEKTCWAS